MISRRYAAIGFAAALLAARAARAAGEDPAVASVRAFYDALLQAMKNGRQWGFVGRREHLSPAAHKFFDFPLMTRLMVGLQWSTLAPALQQQLVAAFAGFSIATYANRFDDYSGERFDVDAEPVSTASGDMIVKSRLVQSSGEPVELDYLMHKEGGAWQAIDVYLSGTVSELATRRSEFSSVLRRDGPQALVELLQRKAQELSS
jgi:phospholipid transport system substrate-binding protein